jgi:peptide/nickel transport system permease protein
MAYLLRRVLAVVPVLVFVGALVFLLLRLAPGDPAVVLAGDYATPEQVATIRGNLGLDQPLPQQFATWAGQVLRGDLGLSIYAQQPVSSLIARRIEPTLVLTAYTVLVAVLLAVPLGVLAAWRAGGVLDRAVMAVAVAGYSTPVFVVGYALVYLLAMQAGWFPAQGYVPLQEGWLACLRSLTLPAITLAFLYMGLIARVTRASVLEVLAQDYVRTARAKGLQPARVLVRHALKNAAVPIVTVVGIGVASLLGGVVVTETVFNIPGLGRLAADAISQRDYPIVQGLILLFAAVYTAVNLLVDLSYLLFDPRIRY